jgi:hypothetical protein
LGNSSLELDIDPDPEQVKAVFVWHDGEKELEIIKKGIIAKLRKLT